MKIGTRQTNNKKNMAMFSQNFVILSRISYKQKCQKGPSEAVLFAKQVKWYYVFV